MSEKKEIVLMYSGGLDTTYVALQLAKEYNKIHLLTFCNGFCIRSGSSKQHVGILRDKLGHDKFEHSIISVAEIFSLFKKNLLKDMLKERSPLLFDLCCRLSMEVATIYYCLDKRIEFATDGNNPATQGEIFLQQEKYLDTARSFFLSYGIKYIHPYEQLKSRDQVIRSLRSAGIKTGVGAFKRIGITTQLFTQPFCLWAPVAFFFTSSLRKLPFVRCFTFPTEDAIAYRVKKERLARDLIDYLKVNKSIAGIYPCKKSNSSRFFKFLYRQC